MPHPNKEKVELSVVIPLYNEEGSTPILYTELSKVLKSLGKSYEILAIDDGSTDNSFFELKKIHEQDQKFKVITFRRNFGQTAAIQAGFDNSSGQIIITIDADLENDPQDIPVLLKKLDEGYDIVSGWRRKRWKGGVIQLLTRKIPSAIANSLASEFSGVPLHDTGCTLKVFRREVIEGIRLYGDMHRFIPAIASQYGAKIAEVKVNFRPRRFGRSKYGLSRTLKVFLDLLLIKFLLGFLTRPIQIFGLLGSVLFILGFFIGLYLTGIKIFLGQSIGGRPLLLLAVLFLVLGVQFIMMGLLGELIARTYFESQGKKTYSIKELLI